jgi:hypothetical protein
LVWRTSSTSRTASWQCRRYKRDGSQNHTLIYQLGEDSFVETPKKDIKTAELNIRLELEHDRWINNILGQIGSKNIGYFLGE